MKQRGDIKVAAGPSDNRILVQPPLFRPSVRLGIPPRGIVHASAGCGREVAGNAWGFVLSQVLARTWETFALSRRPLPSAMHGGGAPRRK